ncbi:MAG: hypothetical protein KDA61_05750 [Planctomycetales bacterium]|nr:hypothetical protein [Planctomycetales bacterium]
MSRPMYPVPADAVSTGASDLKWFAGLAMQAILAKQQSIPNSPAEREEIALWSFRLAEAMVAAEKMLGCGEEVEQC